MQKMGEKYIEYNLKEIDKDRIKKLRKYYKKNLLDLGLNFKVISLECEKEILDFFQKISETRENEQIINSIKKCDLKFLKKMREKLNKYDFNENIEVFKKDDDEDFLKIEYVIKKFEILIQLNGFFNIERDFIDTTIIFLNCCKEILDKYDGNVEYLCYIEELLINNFLSSWENIYFSRKISPTNRKIYYEKFKNFLIDIEEYIEKENEKDGLLKNNNIKYNSNDIIDLFLTLNVILNEKFINEIEYDFNVEMEGIQKEFEEEIKEIISNDLKFKELKTFDVKKDNNFKSRIENIKKLIYKLDKLNAGVNLEETPEILKLLYIIFYTNEDKIKINSTDSKEKKFFTLIRYVLEEKDTDDRILKFLNKYIRKAIFIVVKKEQELKYILELEKLLKKLFKTVNRGTLPEYIYRNLKIIIVLYEKKLNYF